MPISLAKSDALTKARQALADSQADRRSALRAPTGFSSPDDFLIALRKLVYAMPYGTNADIARACGVAKTTSSKWIRGILVPSQANFDKLAAWWRSNVAGKEQMIMAGHAPTAVREAPVLSLASLPADLAARVRRAASRRGLKPIEYVAQILDLHLRKSGD